MSSEPAARLSYEESCRHLQRLGYPDAGAEGVIHPQFDAEQPLGVSFFRTFVGWPFADFRPVKQRDLPSFSRSRPFVAAAPHWRSQC